jgi:hypothetical protein
MPFVSTLSRAGHSEAVGPWVSERELRNRRAGHSEAVGPWVSERELRNRRAGHSEAVGPWVSERELRNRHRALVNRSGTTCGGTGGFAGDARGTSARTSLPIGRFVPRLRTTGKFSHFATVALTSSNVMSSTIHSPYYHCHSDRYPTQQRSGPREIQM